MKKLLLTSAIVAVAGAAVAEVTWTGDAEFGWKSHVESSATPGTWIETSDPAVNGDGLYVDAGLNAKASAELDNGITASIDYGMNFDYAAEGKNNFVTLDNFPTLMFESSVGKMTVGDVDHAAHAMFAGPDAMDVKFTENEDELVARVDAMMSGFTIGGSYTITDTDNAGVAFGKTGLPTGSMTLGGKGEIAGALMSFGYQTGGAKNGADEYEVYGASAGYTWNGIRGVIAYTTDNSEPVNQYSLGLTAGYTMQSGLDIAFGIADRGLSMGYSLEVKFNAMGADVKLGYESDDVDTTDDVISADLAYEIASAGVTVKAGYDSGEMNVIDNNDDGSYYVGAEYGLGNGASVFASYSNGDEIGDAEYNAGASLGVKLSF